MTPHFNYFYELGISHQLPPALMKNSSYTERIVNIYKEAQVKNTDC